MLQHQVLTGSANAGNYCYSVGQLSKFTFWAYGSGCDVIISSVNCHPIQVISGSSNVLITAIDCASSNGKIAVAYGTEIIIYKPESDTLQVNCNSWSKESQFSLDVGDEIAKVLSWNLEGNKLLVGSSFISLWTCATSSDDESVSFHLDTIDDDETECDYETVVTWKQVWLSGMHESPSQLSFSPTQSKHHLFASITSGDFMIKVWYSYTKHVDHVNILSKSVTDQLDFSFTYLLHPQPVVGFEWRKNLIVDGTERFANVLMSSCQDQICRIWVETKKPVSNLMHFQPISSTSAKSRLASETQGDKFKKTTSTPVLSNTSEMLWNQFHNKMESSALRHFHIAATINPSSDIPLLPSFNLQTIPTNSIEGEKIPVFTVHWLNNKYYQHQVYYNRHIQENDLSHEVAADHSAEVGMNRVSDEVGCDGLNSATVENSIRLWRESRDALFSIHPSDGSLLVWHVDWLDEDRSSLIRQPQVCFSSRIPMVFASGDAATVCPRMILFVNYAAEQNLLHSASCMSFKSEDDDNTNKEIMIYSDVKLLSKHNDGSLNLWQISFSDMNDFSSVSSISHSLRLCGHCFHMSDILSHPTLPLLVTTATHSDNTAPENSVSELILWRLNPIGPLAHSGGLSELARVSCQQDHSFTQVAWFSLLFPNWCLGTDNKSPSTGLISFDKNQIQVYQAVVDASQILSEIMSPVSKDQIYSSRDIISQQSSTHPGCLLHLHTESDNTRTWGNILFLDTFDVTLLSPSLNELDSNMLSKFSKSYYVVMVETSSSGTYIHTWLITFSSTLASVKEKRHRKTTVRLYDSSEDESEEEVVYDAPVTFSNVKTNVMKLTTQRLGFSDPIIDTCSGVGKFNLFFMADHNEHIHAAPFHLCTISKNGHVNFWHCSIEEKSANKPISCSWKMWEPSDYQPNSIPSNLSSSYHISVSGTPVLIKAANNTLLASMSIDSASTKIAIVVSIFECASSGGSCWKSQDVLMYYPQLLSVKDIVINNLHLDWLSRQDGSFFLALGYDSHIEIYSLAPKDLFTEENLGEATLEHTNQLLKQSSLDVHTRQKLFTDKTSQIKSELDWRLLKWTKLTELSIQNTKQGLCPTNSDQKPKCRPVTVSWARDGILIVATETEMHVFSQWVDQYKQNAKLSKAMKVTVCDNDVPVAKGLFEVAASLCPSLQQYHPLILSELLNSGHMAAVRKILIHLAICINGDFQDTTCQQVATQLSKYYFCDQLSNSIQLCTSGNRITPLPIHDLVQNNGKILFATENPKSHVKETSDIGLSKPMEVDDTLEDLWDQNEDSDKQSDDELDEILGIKPNKKKKAKAVEHVDLSKFDPNYFGREHCIVIKEFLTRNQLPGLTSLDQMELMALADTINLANTSNFEELSDEKHNGSLHAVNLGERGYAVSGGGAGSLDSCGIRYIMAVHNHLCLLNSLPASNKAALLKQGLSTCHFAWAFHSETEEEMLSLLPSVQKGSPEWVELKSFGVAWWIRSTALLRRLVEQLARAAFLKNNDPLDAGVFYMALNKKAVICGLYRTIKDERMHQFFQRNFVEDRWRRAALKNAFALMGKQRFLHAVAFFLLAGAVQDAAEICIEKLKDFQLALLIVRLRETAEISPVVLLQDHILPCDKNQKNSLRKVKSDSFVRSMAYWTVGKYDKSLSTLLDNLEHEDITDVFNFYVFLRSHPLLLKNKAQMKVGKFGDISTASLKNVTEEERQLIFQTACVHMEAGCPMLALDCLSMLPRRTKDTVSTPTTFPKNELDHAKKTAAVVISRLDDTSNQENNQSNQLKSVDNVDWSQPVEFNDDEELELDWSDEDEAEESDDASRPRISLTLENPIVPAPPVLKNDVITEDVEVSNGELPLQHDVFAEHMKMTACFQVFVQELKSLANAYNADGGQLRTKLYSWLENASNVLQRVFAWDSPSDCSAGLNPMSKKSAVAESSTETDESPSFSSLGAKFSSSQAPSLHELILADNEDWKARRDDFAQRRKWLVCHHNFLRTLLSYSILHDSACGILATVRMELLLLIQESLQEKNSTRSLASPLPLPSDSIPLVTSTIASCKTVVADPLTYLCHMTRDILRAVLDFSVPPHPADETYFAKSAMLCSQAAALSTCIYQSLCDTSTPTFRSQLLKADTHSLDEVAVDGNCFSSSPSTHSTSHLVSPLYVAPTTAPSLWPGVALLQAKLNSDGPSENRTKILVLLCEVTVAVYISLLIHAMHTHSTSLLYRLTNHVLGSKMWNAVYGGGAKIPIKYTKSSSNLKQMASSSMNVSKLRERLNHKVLSTSGDKRGSISASSGGHDSLAYRERFVPPEIGLWDWLLTKPFKIPASDDQVDYDSDVDDDSELSSLEDEDVCDDVEANSTSTETDPNSYSWKIMRLAVVKVVIANLQSVFPLVGFELNELSTNSPFLFAIIKILQEWETKLRADVNTCDSIPENILSLTTHSEGVASSRPAMLRYQAMLEPGKTPFSGSDKVNLGCRRLWHSLVKKEQLQDMFINYIFRDDNKASLALQNVESQAARTASASTKRFESPARIVHKDHELITTFCINNVNSNCISIASAKDVQEIDLTDMLASDAWSWVDDASSNAEKSSLSKDEDFLVISVPSKPRGSQVFAPSTNVPWSSTSQTGQGANILLKRNLSNIRRMESHPTLPYYVTGGRDGAIYMWEWGHQHQISQFLPPGHTSKVCNIHFSSLGNKICSADADGFVTLWQVSLSQRPFFKHSVHDRGASDFCFLSSASVLATTGLSSSSRNVAVWDTLLPRRSVLLKGA